MDEEVRNIHWADYDQTALEPLTLALVVIAALLVLVLDRRRAVVPLIAVATLIPYPQRVMLAGVGFDMMRLMLVCALGRVLARNELQQLRFTRLDKIFLAWAAVMFFVPLVTDPAHAAQQFGFLLDNAVAYLVLRSLVTDGEGLKTVVRSFVVFSVVVCAGMLIERRMGTNYFYLLGSHKEVWIREGEVRATGAFDHAILAGTYGAILFTLSWLLRSGSVRDKAFWIGGMVTGTLIVAASKSSGPLYGFASALFALGLWPLRRHVRIMRNLLWAALIVLHLVMTAPVWALLFKIPDALHLVNGSTSYHRFELIDLAVNHFSEWWLTGISIDEVARWAWGINDITNQFLFVGFASGLLGVILYIRILVCGFGMAGRAAQRADGPAEDSGAAWTAWILGSLLFVHVMCFMGVCYSSGFWFFFNLTIAMVAVGCAATVAVPAPAEVASEPQVEAAAHLEPLHQQTGGLTGA